MNWIDVKDAILKKINFRDFYSRELSIEVSDSIENSTLCPFHNDKNPSFSFNTETGLFKCFAGSCNKAGSVFDFTMFKYSLNFVDALSKLANEYNVEIPKNYKTIKKSVIEEYHQNLLKNKKIIDYLKKNRGIYQNIIEKYKIGWNGTRISIPIKNEIGEYVNIRLYSPDGKKNVKIISYKKGYGKNSIFPIENILNNSDVYIFEGEMDTLLANQLNLNAITGTAGASSWNNEYNRLFKNKNVYICYDIDEDGKKGSLKLANILYKHAKSIKIINLPITKPSNADFTDYIISYNNTIDDFKKLIEDTKPFVKEEQIVDNNVYDVSLYEVVKEQYFNKNIKTCGIVAGKDLAPFFAPKKILFSCYMDNGKTCNKCPLIEYSGNYRYTIKDLDPILLNLISCSETSQKIRLCKEMQIPECSKLEINIEESYNIEEIKIMPEIDFTSEDTEYVLRRAYVMGYGIKCNRQYEFIGKTIPEPKTQYAINLFNQVVSKKDNIEEFKMTEEIKNKLLIFQEKENTEESIKEKLDDIYRDFTYNITKIYQREDLLLAVDLVFHSVLSFNFLNDLIKKGWAELLIIGDTRQGKSVVAKKLIEHYRLGEFTTGENANITGLLGGLQQTAKKWNLIWGKIPLNDKRLLVIDEASGLSTEDFSQLSGVRSEGIAEIIKIQTEKTTARTRLIFISNPRRNRLKDYSFGIMAVKELVGQPEDIARFDFIISIASDEININIINKIHNETVEHKYNYNLCNMLIKWAWSRKPKNIIFDEGVEKDILEYAKLMGNKYTNAIPIVEIANQRIKIAKLSIALACRLFSCDETGENVIVKKHHAYFIYEYLNKIYDKKSFGYNYYSDIKQKENKIKNEEEVKKAIFNLPYIEDCLDILLETNKLNITDLEEFTGLEKKECKLFLGLLRRNGCLVKKHSYYIKTSAFINFLREIKINKEYIDYKSIDDILNETGEGDTLL